MILRFPPGWGVRAIVDSALGDTQSAFEIIDYGYGSKADSPSGTARELAQRLGNVQAPRYAVSRAEVKPPIATLIQRLRALGAEEADEIAARFPRQLRRVGGYNIEVMTPEARRTGRENLARLLVGSEGTLGFSAALTVRLQPVLPRKMVGICQFPSFRAAMEAARHLVTLRPEAVELVDRTMIDLGRGIAIYRPTIDRMVIGEPLFSNGVTARFRVLGRDAASVGAIANSVAGARAGHRGVAHGP